MNHKTPRASSENMTGAREDASHHREKVVGVRENAANVREQKATSRELRIQQQETQLTALDDHLSLLQHANERLLIATVEAHKMAEQVKIATDQMEHAKIAAEKANLAKSNFLSSMSHELRTPLNAILGFAQLLEMGPPAPTAAQGARLNQILTAGWYLLELIDQILDLATIESGKLKLEYTSVSLSELMRECESMIEFQTKKFNVQVNFVPVDPALRIPADRTRLKQIILNLLSNAMKYNHPNGTVEVKCTSLPGHVRINVKDSGMGLSPEMQTQLYQPFNRLGQEHGSNPGTGIGLVVAKQLVELMVGMIGVTSEVGVGSDFWIELPQELPTSVHEIAPPKKTNSTLPTTV